MDDAHARMRALAAEFAQEHELDGSLESLAAFEKLVNAGKKSRSDDALTRWGAYLGETIIRAGDEKPRWLDFAAASREMPSIAKLGLAAETAYVLVDGHTSWFPLVKINKFLDHGAQDSPAAFARVVVGMGSKKSDEKPEPMSAAGVKSFESFFAKPSAATLRVLQSSRAQLRRDEIAQLLREKRIQPVVFYPFFGVAPEGRGYKQVDVGRIAARWVFDVLAATGSAKAPQELTALLEHADKRVRANAAYTLGRVHFQLGEASAGVTQFEDGDATIRIATLDAVRSVVGDAVMKYIQLPPVAAFVSVLTAALRGKPDERTAALESIHQIAVRVRADITTLLDPLLEVLAHGKPAQVEHALQALTSHAHAIKNGRVAFDPRMAMSIPAVVKHSKPLAGKTKATKVQIAARYTLSAYRELADLDAKQRAAVERAFTAIAHAR